VAPSVWELLFGAPKTFARSNSAKENGLQHPQIVREKLSGSYLILRVNERDDSFKEHVVRRVVTQERSENERAKLPASPPQGGLHQAG
jgi:hypothetical protein